MKEIRLRDASRPALFRAIAEIIEEDNPRIPASAVLGETPIATGQLPKIEQLFRQYQIIRDEERFVGCTPDSILDWIENLQKARVACH